MMSAGTPAFILLSINPFGGLLVSIPFAVFALGYPAWLAVASGIPLAYVQVIAVDAGWSWLARFDRWHAFLERRRSPRVERLLAAKGAFLLTMVLAPILGPWLVMAFMRYGQIPQRKVALPILLGLAWNASAIALGCVLFPKLFRH